MFSSRQIIGNYIIFKDKEKLGGGSYGDVYLGQFLPEFLPQNIHQNTLLAIKISPIPENNQKVFYEIAKKEMEILFSFKDDRPKHIVQFIDAFRQGSYFYTVMEYCNQKNLQEWIKDNPNISEREVMNIFSQIVEAFKYLFSKKIMHRDLKPDNILMHNYQVKLCDFGMAKHFEQGQENTIVGTEAFQAPELLAGSKEYTYKADIWSLGVILYYMLFKQYFWEVNPNSKSSKALKSKLAIKNQITRLATTVPISEFPPFPSQPKVGPVATYLLRKMLAYKEADRIDWEEIFSTVDKMQYYHDKLNIYTQPEMDIQQREMNQPLNSQLLNLDARKSQGVDMRAQSCVLSKSDEEISEQFLIQYYSKDKMTKQARQVTARFDYEWQICRFIFNIIKNVIKFKSLLPLDVFLGIEFLLNKRIFLHFKMLTEILNYKKNVLEIAENEWNSFLMCKDPDEYQKTFVKIEEDFKIYESNFKSIPQEIIDNIDKLGQNEQEEIKSILKDIASMDIFIKDLENYCIKLLKVLRPTEALAVKLQTKQRNEDVLYLIDDLFILLTIKTSLKWDPNHPINIYKFYENRKQLDQNILKERIDKAYAFLESENSLANSQRGIFCFMFSTIFCVWLAQDIIIYHNSKFFQFILECTYFLTLLTYFIAAIKNPGICLPTREASNDFQNNFCKLCRVQQSKQTQHCVLCNVCINELDHHSFWLGKCIGEGNQKEYKLFIIFIIILFVLNIMSGIFNI